MGPSARVTRPLSLSPSSLPIHSPRNNMSTATEDTPRSTLYVFPAGSVWSAPVLLAAAEKGLNESSGLLIKTVNLRACCAGVQIRGRTDLYGPQSRARTLVPRSSRVSSPASTVVVVVSCQSRACQHATRCLLGVETAKADLLLYCTTHSLSQRSKSSTNRPTRFLLLTHLFSRLSQPWLRRTSTPRPPTSQQSTKPSPTPLPSPPSSTLQLSVPQPTPLLPSLP